MVKTPHANLYRVRIRRAFFGEVKESAEQIDGKEFRFSRGWHIEGGMYDGEVAMLPLPDQGYPEDGPTWVASGDLEIVW